MLSGSGGRPDPLPDLAAMSGDAIACLAGLALCGAGFAVPAAACLDPDSGDPVGPLDGRVDCPVAAGRGWGRLGCQSPSAAAGFPFGCPFSIITSNELESRADIFVAGDTALSRLRNVNWAA